MLIPHYLCNFVNRIHYILIIFAITYKIYSTNLLYRTEKLYSLYMIRFELVQEASVGSADSSSFHILIVLSHSAVIILRELLSNLMSKIAASLERDPG